MKRVSAIARLVLGVAMAAVSAALFMNTDRYVAAVVYGTGAGLLAIWGVYTGLRDLF